MWEEGRPAFSPSPSVPAHQPLTFMLAFPLHTSQAALLPAWAPLPFSLHGSASRFPSAPCVRQAAAKASTRRGTIRRGKGEGKDMPLSSCTLKLAPHFGPTHLIPLPACAVRHPRQGQGAAAGLPAQGGAAPVQKGGQRRVRRGGGGCGGAACLRPACGPGSVCTLLLSSACIETELPDVEVRPACGPASVSQHSLFVSTGRMEI